MAELGFSVPIVVGGLALVLQIITSAGAPYRTARFGLLRGAIVYALGLIDTDTLQQRHWDINCWSDDKVLDWRAAQLASCNAIVVAVSICPHYPLRLACTHPRDRLGGDLCKRWPDLTATAAYG